ncbi:MAG: Tll0287-like domain-containing protein [Gammaproteobacteria bacterium]
MLTAMLAVACGSERDRVAVDPAQLLAGFKQQLQGALKAGLAEGPVAAIAACSIEAPKIAAAASRDGIRVGRASHRLRNPANTAPAWVAPILAAYVDNPTDLEPRTVELDAGRAGYVEPIVMQPVCSTCHGKSVGPEIAARIAELYPDDRATGFDVGELRGVFWVEYPGYQ